MIVGVQSIDRLLSVKIVVMLANDRSLSVKILRILINYDRTLKIVISRSQAQDREPHYHGFIVRVPFSIHKNYTNRNKLNGHRGSRLKAYDRSPISQRS